MAFRFQLWLRGITMLLALQFLLGIWVNLFGTFPRTTSLATALTYTGDPALTAHMLLAVVIVVVGFVVAVVAFLGSAPDPRLRWILAGGLISTLFAYEWGVRLILADFASNTDSFWMAVGFIAAVAFYGIAQTMVAAADASRSRPLRPAKVA
ncbi:MAG TPA: hypothetical protein VMG36_06370 [Thermoplasmata archaeon]|nr:hypothetical protein [Thermoplasmata archaeon]